MLVDELISLLERQRSAEQMLYTFGSRSRQCIEEFERFNEQKAQLMHKLRGMHETS